MPEDHTPSPEPPDQEAQAIQEPQKPAQRHPLALIGWLVSGALLLQAIFGAVYEYATRETGERSFQALQLSLRYSVSLPNVDLPLPNSVFDWAQVADEELNGVLDAAERSAAESEEAARIALAAAFELGEPPSETAIQTLAASDDELSRAIGELYGGDVVTSASVDELREHDSQEFAVRLAQVHAKEMLNMDGGREDVADGRFAIALTAVNFAMPAAAAVGFVALVLFFANRSSGRWRPVGFAGGVTHADGNRYMMRFAFYLVTFSFIPFLISRAMKGSGLAGNWQSLIVMGGFTLFMLATLWRPVLGKVDRLPRLVGEKRGLLRLVGVGLFGYLTTVPLLVLALVAVNWLSRYLPSPEHPISEQMVGVSGVGWLPILLTTAVVVPLLEETMFRGLLFPAIASRVGRPALAILVSAFLFAAIHPQGPLMWPALMVVGGAAAYMRYHTGSLIPSYTLHIVHNGIIVTVMMLLA